MKVYNKSAKKKSTKLKLRGNEQASRRSGLTGQFKIVNIDKDSSSDTNIKIDTCQDLSKKDENPTNFDKPGNPFIKNFKRRFEMQKCSSANNILKASFKNRISLSPIENKQKAHLNNQLQINPFQLACVTPDLDLNQEKKIIDKTDTNTDQELNQIEMTEQVEKTEELASIINESSLSSGNESISTCSSSSVNTSSNASAIENEDLSSCNNYLKRDDKVSNQSELFSDYCCSCLNEESIRKENNFKRITFKNQSQLVQEHQISALSLTDGYKVSNLHENTNISSYLNSTNKVFANKTNHIVNMTPPHSHISSFSSSFLIGNNNKEKVIDSESFKSPMNNQNVFIPNGHSSKTPKSVIKRGQVLSLSTQKNRHVFGTPDYLCPELLMADPHDESVDW